MVEMAVVMTDHTVMVVMQVMPVMVVPKMRVMESPLDIMRTLEKEVIIPKITTQEVYMVVRQTGPHLGKEWDTLVTITRKAYMAVERELGNRIVTITIYTAENR